MIGGTHQAVVLKRLFAMRLRRSVQRPLFCISSKIGPVGGGWGYQFTTLQKEGGTGGNRGTRYTGCGFARSPRARFGGNARGNGSDYTVLGQMAFSPRSRLTRTIKKRLRVVGTAWAGGEIGGFASRKRAAPPDGFVLRPTGGAPHSR